MDTQPDTAPFGGVLFGDFLFKIFVHAPQLKHGIYAEISRGFNAVAVQEMFALTTVGPEGGIIIIWEGMDQSDFTAQNNGTSSQVFKIEFTVGIF